MVSCRYLRNVKQQIDMLISLRYLQDNWFYLGGVSFVKETLPKISSSTSMLQGLVEFLLTHMEKCSTFVCEISRPGENNKELIEATVSIPPTKNAGPELCDNKLKINYEHSMPFYFITSK
jgi:hypothetical protein